MTTVDASIEFTDTIDGSLHVPLGLISLDTADATERQAIQVGLFLHGTLVIDVPAPQVPAPTLRALPTVVITVPTPTLAAGVPLLPRIMPSYPSSATVLQGAGHARSLPDPDPVWEGPDWAVPPPSMPAGAHLIRWSARDLPDPAEFTDNVYPLGEPSSADGTSGIRENAQMWHASAGSYEAINFRSAYPFKPTVGNHTHYGTNGKLVVITRAVRFNASFAEHMWADTGTFLTPPFTLMFIGLITHFRTRAWRQRIFDSGFDPRPFIDTDLLAAWGERGVTGAVAVPEDYGYRTALQVQRTQLVGFNDQHPTTRIARSPFTHTYSPKMMFLIVAGGSQSYVGSYSLSGNYRSRVTFVGHGAQRNLVMGRVNGMVGLGWASDMVVFEVRAIDKALSAQDLQHHFDQVSSTWKFHEYA